MRRMAKRLKRQGVDERGALASIKEMLGRMGYHNLTTPSAITDAVEDVMIRLGEFESGTATVSTSMESPPLEMSPATAGMLPDFQAAFSLAPAAAPAPSLSLALPDLRALSARPAPVMAAAPVLALSNAGAPPAAFDPQAFQAKLDAKMRESEKTGIVHRPPGSNGKVTRGPPKLSVAEQYEMLEKITGKHAAPAPPSGRVIVMAR
jgi:hypothetical protein